MASYTTNLNLKKPAGSENVAIGDINNNMDTIDQAYGTLNSNINTFKTMLSVSTPYTSLDDIPVNGLGRIQFGASISPTGDANNYAVICCGNNSSYRTILAISTSSNGVIYQIRKNGSSWSSWAQLNV